MELKLVWDNAWVAFFESLKQDGWSDQQIKILRLRLGRGDSLFYVWDTMQELEAEFADE